MTTVEELFRVLGSMTEAHGGDLSERLSVSRATLSRLVSRAGEEICRMGRTRATSYARTRSLPGIGTRLPLYRISDAAQVGSAGELRLLAGGSHWLETQPGIGTRFEGLPPFAADMSPQGYLGHAFPRRHPELDLPGRIVDWNDDHRLIALARRGEDCTGDYVIGKESLDRWLEVDLVESRQADYPRLARQAASGPVGSSAAGEQPKFTAFAGGRHVLVKFAKPSSGAASRRWSDLLVAESLALGVIHGGGGAAAEAGWFDVEGERFLEVVRFDRAGARGRKGLVSLAAIDNEHYGHADTWTKAALRMRADLRISEQDARRMRWLDVFGQLIGNTDRHFGNLSFFPGDVGGVRLAPAYDMLPMFLAPSGADLVERRFEPAPPTADSLEVWPDAALQAVTFWERVAGHDAISPEVRTIAEGCRDAVSTLYERAPVIATPAR